MYRMVMYRSYRRRSTLPVDRGQGLFSTSTAPAATRASRAPSWRAQRLRCRWCSSELSRSSDNTRAPLPHFIERTQWRAPQPSSWSCWPASARSGGYMRHDNWRPQHGVFGGQFRHHHQPHRLRAAPVATPAATAPLRPMGAAASSAAATQLPIPRRLRRERVLQPLPRPAHGRPSAPMLPMR